MKFEGTFIRGRIARRILALFVLSALVPALLLAVLALGQVRALLTHQAQRGLADASRAYALNVYERLLLAHQGLQQVAASLRDGATPGASVLKTLGSTYASLSIVGPRSRPVALLGTPLPWPGPSEAQRAHLAADESVLLAQAVPRAAPRILLLQPIDAAQPGGRVLLAQLRPAALWGAPDSFSDTLALCVRADSGIRLFCSQPDAADRTAAPANGETAASEARAGAAVGQTVSGEWRLFLKPKFFTPYWTFIASEPAAGAFAPVEGFTRIFLGVIALAILMVALLSVSQIRRTMGPLERLIKGTRRLAMADFSQRVAVDADDEFGELAASFNDMAGRLGRQLETLKVLSSIDQVILSKLDIDPVFAMVLSQFRDLTPAGLVEIVVLEPSGAGAARIYALAAGRRDQPAIGRICVAPQLAARIAGNPDGFWLDEQAGPALLPPPGAQAVQRQRLFVLPIMDRGRLCAFACLGLDDGVRLADEVRAPLRDLCDRIGVALSAAARDEQLVYQIRHDDLTGLPNRLLFKERLSQEIAYAQRERRNVALLYLDLDRFKNVNDSLGHTAGDELLRQTAARMRACLRESDSLARLGGDEFAIILPNVAGPRGVTGVAEKLVEALADPFVVGQHESYVSASIGIAVCPTDGVDSDDLLKKADTAMYRAKDGGRGRFVFFEERMNAEALQRLSLERELRQALLRGEFLLHYQPQYELRAGRISGAEALLRWNHPTRGLVTPGVFIGVAEDTGLIEEIGRRVLREACRQHAAWRDAGLKPPRIAVNVSGRQFRRGDLVQVIDEALRDCGTLASALEVEVTESLFMDESANAVAVLGQLRQMGVHVAIDDFGTGYSSMSYLKRLPVDVLKVDQSFISDMTDNHDARAIAKAVVTLGHTLNKVVVAEGVESAEQLALLKRWKCNRAQGYHLGHPLPPQRFAQLLRGQQPDTGSAEEPADLTSAASRDSAF